MASLALRTSYGYSMNYGVPLMVGCYADGCTVGYSAEVGSQ